MTIEVKFNTWRQDLYDAEGDLIEKDVLFIRGELENYAVQAPLFEGEQRKQNIDDLMTLIGMQVRRVVLDNG